MFAVALSITQQCYLIDMIASQGNFMLAVADPEGAMPPSPGPVDCLGMGLEIPELSAKASF